MHWGTAPIRVPDKSLLSIGEVAEALGYSERSLRTMIRDGAFPPGKSVAGRDIRWSNMTVAAWLLWVEHCQPTGATPGRSSAETPRDAQDG